MKGTRGYGELGEDFAVKLLKNKGYKIIDRNFRSKLGEIDIIAIEPSKQKGQEETLVFVEVKTRRSYKYGKPEEAVTPKKLQSIKKTAKYFVKINDNLPRKLRIDVVAIEVEAGIVSSAKLIKVI